MIPLEMQMDKKGLLFIRDDNILREQQMMIDRRKNLENRYYQNGFYKIPSTDDYIIKYSYTCFTRKEIKAIKYMLETLISKQSEISEVDFPIGYFAYRKTLTGLIVRYYKNGQACDNIFETHEIEYLGKYYYHDEDNIRNLFILFDELLNIIYKMFENGIYYSDTNPGNIIIDDNALKLIDFDYRYVFFDNKDLRLKTILRGFSFFLKDALKNLQLDDNIDSDYKNFDEAKKYIKSLENKVRKG